MKTEQCAKGTNNKNRQVPYHDWVILQDQLSSNPSNDNDETDDENRLDAREHKLALAEPSDGKHVDGSGYHAYALVIYPAWSKMGKCTRG